jgi:peptidoglycan hydrolase CwlO-like protein
MDTVLRFAEVAIVPLMVALIAASATIVSVRRLRSENNDQHHANADLLNHLSSQVGGIDSKVDRLDARLDNVQSWQADHEKAHLIDNRDRTVL